MPCIFDIKPEERHCRYCSAFCDERQPKPIETHATNKIVMTDNRLAKARAEIERRYKYNKEHENDWAGTSHFWQRKEDEEILSFIDSLQEEPISEDLERAIDAYLATYFGGEKEKQDWPFLKKMAIHFAEWQKEQLMTKAIDGEVGYWNLRGLSINTDLPRSVSEAM